MNGLQYGRAIDRAYRFAALLALVLSGAIGIPAIEARGESPQEAIRKAFSVVGKSTLTKMDVTADHADSTKPSNIREAAVGTVSVNIGSSLGDDSGNQLPKTTTFFPFVNVAASARGTVVRIDANTGQIVGEYRAAPEGRGLNTSRTTVDHAGNVWAGNRGETADGKGSVVKIGLVIGGTRVNADRTPNANGDYLAPPFDYNTCVDRDRDGLIKTSRGLGDIRPWPNVTDGAGGDTGIVEDADDECVLIYQRVSGTVVRHLSVDANDDVWVGGYPDKPTFFDKLDGDTGQILFTFDAKAIGCGGYGGLVDRNGVLWSADYHKGSLLRYDTSNNTGTCIQVSSSYGLGIDTNGFIWNSMYGRNTIVKVSPDGVIQAGFPKTTGGAGDDRGVAVTPADNHVWVANSGGDNVSRLDNDGNLLKVITVANTPTGVAVDVNGKVWVVNLRSHNVMRIDPKGGPDSLGAVDLTVNLNAPGLPDAGPYNYSDMTGAVVGLLRRSLGSLSVVETGQRLGVAQLELIFDASGSMWGKVEGRTKIGIAKDVMVEIIKNLPDDLRVALRVYGHRIPPGQPSACRDSELVFPFAKIDKAQMLSRVRSLQALGTTPIAYSLQQVASDFGSAPGEKVVILVTDGKEECKGNPSAAVSELVARGLKVRLNVVGFDLAEEAVKQEMRRVAELTGGLFFDAKDAEGLRKAIEQSLGVPYEVLDVGGKKVASGLTGRVAIKVPDGTYTVVVAVAGKQITISTVRIAENKSTQIELKKEGQKIVSRIVEP